MRILLAIDGMHPRDGGPPRVVAGSARALRRRGLDVDVMTTVRPGDEEVVRATWRDMLADGVRLHFIPEPGLAAIFSAKPASAEVDALVRASDVVHLHALWSPVMAAVAHHARRIGRAYFVSTHGVLDRRAMRSIRSKWWKKRIFIALAGVRRILRDAAGVVFGSEAEDSESLTLAPIRRLFIPNGVDASVRREPLSGEQRATIDEIAPQVASWSRTLLYFSRIHPEKGLDMLVSAFNAVARDFPGAGLFVAGIRQDDAYQHLVEELIAQGGLGDRIVLTTELTGSRSQFLHSACDIFMLPSQAEGFSVALVEALAHGMPCLVTQYCHAPFIESAEAGVVVSPSPAGIADGLRRLLSLDDFELSAMGHRARALFDEKFTWEKVAEQLEASYRAANAGAIETS